MHAPNLLELDTVKTDADAIAFVLRYAASLPDADRKALCAWVQRTVSETATRMVSNGIPPSEAMPLAVIALGSLACLSLFEQMAAAD